jgi:hypothetical protein
VLLLERDVRRPLADNDPVTRCPVDPDLAGYVLEVPAPEPPGHEVLPEQFLATSDCLMADLPRPDFWDWSMVSDWQKRASIRRSCARIVDVAMEPGDASVT